jgi:predicted TIM-barrel fold metal-dependent hydrolase
MISNDDVDRLCTTHPDRFIGVASVDLTRPVAAVAELKRCVEELGFRALRVLPWLWGLPPDDRRY